MNESQATQIKLRKSYLGHQIAVMRQSSELLLVPGATRLFFPSCVHFRRRLSQHSNPSTKWMFDYSYLVTRIIRPAYNLANKTIKQKTKPRDVMLLVAHREYTLLFT